jgi:SAM-dependent methyltransferase
MKILDVGCGKRKYESDDPKDKIIGVDINRDSQADIIYNLNKRPWKPFKTNEFDKIYSSHCIEHLNDWVDVLKEMIRITKPNGIIEILTPHFSSGSAFSTIGHVNYYGVSTFTLDLPELIKDIKLEKIELRYLYSVVRDKNIFRKLSHNIITSLANLSQPFCERIWCYWVGGFDEIYILFRVIKNERK